MKCSRCLVDKEISEFHKGHYECKTCRSIHRFGQNFVVDGFKICDTCYENKPIDEFSVHVKSKDGYKYTCNCCLGSKKLKKICLKCNVEKNMNDFYFDKRKKDGRVGKCKECSKTILTEEQRLHRNKLNRESRRKRLSEDSLYKFSLNVRKLILNTVKGCGYTKKSKTFQILGCSFEEFKLYIENQFEAWMNWNNHGIYTGNYDETWQLDHIIPISSALSEEEVMKLNHYSNFQPLCSKKNNEKSNSF